MNSIFVWIPKTAGTSVHSILEKFGCSKYKKVPFEFNHKGLVTFSHMSVYHLVEKGYLNKNFYKEAFKFAFVRNPFDRLVSLYFYRNRRKDSIVYNMTFKQFCFFLKKEGIPNIGCFNYMGMSQAAPQIKWAKNMDFIGKYETLQVDFEFVCEKLNIPKQKLPVKNKTEHKHYKEYYDTELVDLVSEIYAEDLSIFKYGF